MQKKGVQILDTEFLQLFYDDVQNLIDDLPADTHPADRQYWAFMQRIIDKRNAGINMVARESDLVALAAKERSELPLNIPELPRQIPQPPRKRFRLSEKRSALSDETPQHSGEGSGLSDDRGESREDLPEEDITKMGGLDTALEEPGDGMMAMNRLHKSHTIRVKGHSVPQLARAQSRAATNALQRIASGDEVVKKGQKGSSLFVGNAPSGVTIMQIKHLFKGVRSIAINKIMEYVVIQFWTRVDALKALEVCHSLTHAQFSFSLCLFLCVRLSFHRCLLLTHHFPLSLSLCLHA